MDAHFRSFTQKVVPLALVKEGIGILGTKSMGSGVILQEQGRHAGRVPALRHDPCPRRWSSPASTAMNILKQDLQAVKDFQPLTEEADRGPAGKDGRAPPPKAGSSRSRRPASSTAPPTIPNGWDDGCAHRFCRPAAPWVHRLGAVRCDFPLYQLVDCRATSRSVHMMKRPKSSPSMYPAYWSARAASWITSRFSAFSVALCDRL